MLLKFVYTLVLVFSLSAFASSNECARSSRESHPRTGTPKGLQTVPEQQGQPEKEVTQDAPLQVLKFLYI